MRKTYLAVIGFVLVLSFQNCSQAPQPGGKDVGAGEASAPTYNKYSVSSYSTLAVWDYVRSQYLDVNLQTGEMVSYAEAGQVRGETFCVPLAQMKELHQILNSAEVCEPIVNSQELAGQVCTMQYRYPYASLVDKSDEVRLGEKTNGCDVPIDLCGDKAQQLKNWTKSIVSNLSQMTCQ
jgi:hypothetical protein